MTTESLGAALHALSRAHRTTLATLLAPHGLHAGQDLLLLAIWETAGLRQSELADQLGVEPPTITRMLQRLERSGMIERRRDPHDARVVHVHATPRSRLLESSVRRAWTSIDELVIAQLGEREASELRRLAVAAAAAIVSNERGDANRA
jgi:DNA-binding MarR family transcriptional regulator